MDLVRLSPSECIDLVPSEALDFFGKQTVKYLEKTNICAKRETNMPTICQVSLKYYIYVLTYKFSFESNGANRKTSNDIKKIRVFPSWGSGTAPDYSAKRYGLFTPFPPCPLSSTSSNMPSSLLCNLSPVSSTSTVISNVNRGTAFFHKYFPFLSFITLKTTSSLVFAILCIFLLRID